MQPCLRNLAVSISFVFCLLPQVGQAQNEIDFRVEEEERELLEKLEYVSDSFEMREPEDAELVATLERTGLVEVSNGFQPIMTNLHIAHVFASDDLSKMISIRYDLSPKDSSLNGRLLKLPTGRLLLHTKTSDRRPVAVLFEGFKQIEVNGIMLKVQQSVSLNRSRRNENSAMRLLNLLLPKAHASAGSSCNSSGNHMMPVENGRISKGGATLMRSVSACGSAFVTALADATDIGIKSFFTGGWANGITKAYGTFKQLISQGTSVFIDAVGETITHISAEVMTAVVCYAATSAAANYAIGLATGGTALPMIILNSLKKIKKIAAWLKIVMETRVVRNARYLSSAIEGRTPTARLRDDDLLAMLNKGEPSELLSKVKKTKKVESDLTRSLQKANCVVRANAGSVARHQVSSAVSSSTGGHSASGRSRGPSAR